MARLLAHRFKRERLAERQWLPEDMYDWLAERIVQAAGLVLLMLALASWLALITYNSADPSFNTASNAGLEAIHNWLGLWGSYAADILHQGFGIGSYLLVIVLAAWAWRVATARGLGPFLLRCLTALATLVFAAIGMQSLLYGFGYISSSFNMPAGGLLGQLAYAFLHNYELGRGIAVAMGLSGIVLATGFLYLCCGLSLEEWQHVLRYLQRLMEHAGRFSLWAAKSAWKWLMKEDVEEAPRLVMEQRTPVDEELEENVAPTLVRTKKKQRQVIRKPKAAPVQPQLDFANADTGAMLPPLNLLQLPEQLAKPDDSVSEASLEKNARMLENVLGDFGVQGRITQVSPGPVITLYELEPAPGIKSSRVISLADDVARSMSATSVRIAVVPGKNVIGMELPNRDREKVFLRELLVSEAHHDTSLRLPLAMGKDIGGAPVVADLARMPHLLVAGTTGSGKSVAINTMILSLLYRHSPRECRFIMIDPKMLELSIYEGIPHLLAPVVTEPRKAIFALKWTVREMEERYRKMSHLGVRNIDGYNMRLKEARDAGKQLSRKVQTGFDPDTGKPVFEDQGLDLNDLPYIVVIVDEMADLMLVAGKEIEGAIQRLAQMARAAGIHLIMATQRPSVDVITGTIKANFPSRVSFQVTSKIDSRTILGEQGAEQLLGQGDMLYMAGGGRITRVHGPFVSDGEVQSIVNYLKEQGEPEYLEAVTEEESEGGSGNEGTFGQGNSSGDELYDKAVDIVLRERKASTSFIQRHLQIGYNRAARIMEQMEKDGIVGAPNHVGKREILGRSMEE
jgi:DNA segregation ATPase FtsK/SpoIIIE, S-DNA-T family